MPKALSTALIQEKNSLGSASPWLVMLDITLPSGAAARYVRNNEDVVFQGHTYLAANFEADATEEDIKGNIPQFSLKVADFNQSLQAYLQAEGGGIGSRVVIRFVSAAHLSEDYTDLECGFEVMSTRTEGYAIVFSLGIPSPLRRRFPLYRTRGAFCNWVRWYKGPECGYSGSLATCTGTLDDCRAHGNSRRFGGQPGLTGGGFRVA
jgi:phage-related protein